MFANAGDGNVSRSTITKYDYEVRLTKATLGGGPILSTTGSDPLARTAPYLTRGQNVYKGVLWPSVAYHPIADGHSK